MSYNRDPDSLEDIINAIRFVTEYAATVSEDTFSVDHVVQNVILKDILIIGEAVRRISKEFIQSHPEIPFGDMIAMRNAIIHDYDDVRLPWVWSTIKNDFPGLLRILEPIFEEMRRS